MENSEVKKAPVREQVGTYQNVSVYVSGKMLNHVPANNQLGIEEHHFHRVFISNASRGEKPAILNEHFYGLIRSDVGRPINATVTITKKIVTGNRTYLSVDVRKTSGESESVYLLNIGRPEIAADVQIPYTNAGICIVPKSAQIRFYTNVSKRVANNNLIRVPANTERGIEEHFQRSTYFTNAHEGGEPVIVDLRYYGVTEQDIDQRVNFNISIVEHASRNGCLYLEVSFRKAIGRSESYFKFNTERPELGGDVRIPDANASICIVPNTKEGERAYLEALENALYVKDCANRTDVPVVDVHKSLFAETLGTALEKKKTSGVADLDGNIDKPSKVLRRKKAEFQKA